jgi:hypothetical protein
MATAAVQLSIIREATASAPVANSAAQNTSPAQSNTKIEDTVTLTAQDPQPQRTQPSQAPPQTPPRSQSAQTIVAGTQAQLPKGPAPALNQTPTQGDAAEAQTLGANQATAVYSAPAGTTNTATPSSAASNAAQQRLAQLEAMLQQLGIDPRSLSGPALTALLSDATDPAALLTYVKELQGTAPPAAPPSTHVNVTV